MDHVDHADQPDQPGRAARPSSPIREELRTAQATVLERWATPGSFWTAAQRLAIVEQVRRARDATPLAPWEAPSGVDGLTGDGTELPAAAVDAVWRLTNHPGTLTHSWYQQLLDRGLAAGPYVELVAVVAQANLVDRFADALDLDRPPLPPPTPGAPTGEVAPGCAVRDHWVPTAPIKGPNVIKALSLLPFENGSRALLSDVHYVPDAALLGDLASGHGALSRPQIELIAARTSTLNECFY